MRKNTPKLAGVQWGMQRDLDFFQMRLLQEIVENDLLRRCFDYCVQNITICLPEIKTQDPEMMREAQKMMQDPAFQARMKQITENDQFKNSMENTKEMMKDKDKVKELEDSMKKRVEEGSKELDEFKKKSKELEEEEKKGAEESAQLKVRFTLVL